MTMANETDSPLDPPPEGMHKPEKKAMIRFREAKKDPAAVYDDIDALVTDPMFSAQQKRDLIAAAREQGSFAKTSLEDAERKLDDMSDTEE